MTKQGALDNYARTVEEELRFAEETAMAQTALAVADLLTSANMTQRGLAERVGVSEARISQILRADSNPTVRTIARIGHVLGHRLLIDFRAPVTTTHTEAKPWRSGVCSVAQWERAANDEPEEAIATAFAA